jgi:hypothetical protein
MGDLRQLAARDRAVLSLVVARSMRFAEIGTLLRMDPAVIRERAHAAAIHLATPPEDVDPRARERILDFVLGQRSAGDVVDELRIPALRQWTISLTNALAPLSRHEMPRVSARAQPAPAAEPSVARAPAIRLRWRPRPRLLGALLAPLAIAAAAAIVIVAVTNSRSTPTTGVPPQGPVPSVQMVRRLVLRPTPIASGAAGAGAVIRRGSSLQLVLQARGLARNSSDSYAVWLFNTRVDARLLGFVTPPVGSAGTFSSGVTLPTDAIRFRLVLVTRETSAQPTAPGTALLRGPLSLS